MTEPHTPQDAAASADYERGDLPAAVEGGNQGAARDVLVDRISTWVDDDGGVYDYADRLIRDLYLAGYDIVHRSIAAGYSLDDLRGDIAMLVTVYDEHVAPDARGPWRDERVTRAPEIAARLIREARRSHPDQLSQADLAERMTALGCRTSREVIANIESGRRDDVGVRELIAASIAASNPSSGSLVDRFFNEAYPVPDDADALSYYGFTRRSK